MTGAATLCEKGGRVTMFIVMVKDEIENNAKGEKRQKVHAKDTQQNVATIAFLFEI
jgi:hypothetical protein